MNRPLTCGPCPRPSTEEMPMKSITRRAAAVLLFVFAQSHTLLAQSSLPETFRIVRATATIKIDGNLSDEGWQAVKPVQQRMRRELQS